MLNLGFHLKNASIALIYWLIDLTALPTCCKGIPTHSEEESPPDRPHSDIWSEGFLNNMTTRVSVLKFI